MNRRDAYRKHAENRASERYRGAQADLSLRIRRMIRRHKRKLTKKYPRGCLPIDPNCSCVRKAGPTRSLWNVRVDEQLYRIIFDDPTGEVVTFLPIEITR